VEALSFIADGLGTNEALAQAAGVEEAKLVEAFHGYLELRMAPLDNLPQAQSAPAHLAPLDPAVPQPAQPEPGGIPSSPFTDALRDASLAKQERRWEDAVELLESAYRMYPDYEGEDAPLRQLAALHRERGNEAAYRETLERLAYSSPRELHATKSLLREYQDDADWPEVLETARWALGIDPYDPALYRAEVEALRAMDQLPEALAPLATLTYLDPGNAIDYRYERAQVLAEAGAWDPARRELLKLLEESPYFWGAQSLLLEIAENAEIAPEPAETGG
jgi:tetratricopeptide (TPR) repeat protein